MKKIMLLLLVISGITSCHSLNDMFGLSDDNKIEEGVEELIETNVDVKIDLTGDSYELK